MPKNIIIYSKDNCMPCKFTKNALMEAGIPFTEKNISNDEQGIEEVKSFGYTGVPLVVADGEPIFQGFDQDGIQYLKEQCA